MPEKEFNLIDEPWVRVIRADGSMEEVSLRDALVHAHEFIDLGGETQTQNIAVLRLLLAVLHTVFSRMDENGEDTPLEDEEEALDRWAALWENGSFPERPITKYLLEWYERFWLFHPERPFMQSVSAKNGTQCAASKLIGDLSESSNKLRLFQSRSGDGKQRLSYAEAARWLLYLNGFDDAALKPHIPKEQRQSTISVAWLGKLGLIYARGRTLYETLLLNLTLLRDGMDLWDKPLPDWERETPREMELREIPVPNDPAALLTLRSRLILLTREHDAVINYGILCGDSFRSENAFAEQMTVWRYSPEKKSQAAYYYPQMHLAEKQMWRDFANMFAAVDHYKLPGVVEWIRTLQKEKILQRKEYIEFGTVGNRYDSSQKSTVTDSIGDSLTFHTTLFNQMNLGWRKRIAEEIQTCDNIALEISRLAGNIYISGGGDPENTTPSASHAKEQWYARLDTPFRTWLCAISPETDRIDAKIGAWQQIARQTALSLGGELVAQVGDAALFGRTIERKFGSKTKKQHYSAPEAYLWFTAKLYQAYPKEEKT